MITKFNMYDFKPTILYVCTIMLNNIDDVLKTSALLLNLSYLGYQFYKFHKKNKEQ